MLTQCLGGSKRHAAPSKAKLNVMFGPLENLWYSCLLPNGGPLGSFTWTCTTAQKACTSVSRAMGHPDWVMTEMCYTYFLACKLDFSSKEMRK